MEDRRRNDALLIVGVIVLLIGLALLGRTLNVFPPFVFEVLRIAARATGPLALIILGVIVIVVASRGGVSPAMPAAGVKLYRSRTNRMIAGVAGGLAEYFGIDALVVRLVFVAVALASFGTALVVYIVLAVLMPEAPVTSEVQGPHA
ncbi:MAG TPA: PspC domain-containing protein [Coriobacteriia bacterium]|jgi:phage shock protein C